MNNKYKRRKNRRRAIEEIINRLKLIQTAEDAYYKSIPDHESFYDQESDSENTIALIDEAIDSLSLTYET